MPSAFPIGIGGVGGSGTRLVAELVERSGFYLGEDVNASLDNLWFTLLFKRLSILDATENEIEFCFDLFLRRMRGDCGFSNHELSFLDELALLDRGEHKPAWLRERVETFLTARPNCSPNTQLAWKEPNTHIVADRLLKSHLRLRYIHVIRNGLDMALSDNQQQLDFWGRRLIGDTNVATRAAQSLHYWCAAHQRLFKLLAPYRERVLLVSYDQLCIEPAQQIDAVLRFIGISNAPGLQQQLIATIRPPESIGRFRDYSLSHFRPKDIAYVASLGFPTA